MSNCLITKLKGNIDNQKLLKLGEIRYWLSMDKPYSSFIGTHYIVNYGDNRIECLEGQFQNYPKVIETSGPGNHSNSLVINEPVYISQRNKYNICSFQSNILGSVEFTLEDFIKFNTAHQHANVNISLNFTFANKAGNLSGDISALSTVKNKLSSFQVVFNTKGRITGDIEVFRDCPNLTILQIREQYTYGDITALNNKQLSGVYLGPGYYYGDISQVNAPTITFEKFVDILPNMSYNVTIYNENENNLSWEHHNNNPAILRGANLGDYLDDYLRNLSTHINVENTVPFYVYGTVTPETYTLLNAIKTRHPNICNLSTVNDIIVNNMLAQ